MRNTQCGHSPICKARMMKLMAQDRDDRHRAKKRFMEKGIEATKEEQDASMAAQGDSGRKRQPDHDAGAMAKSQRGLSNPSSGIGLVRDRAADGGGDEDHAKRARISQDRDKRRQGASAR